MNLNQSKPIFFLLTISTSLIFCNFIYDPDDWYIINQPRNITAITQDRNSVYFAAENGIFSFDQITEDLTFNTHLSNGIADEEIFHFFYDDHTDHFWIIQRNSINIKTFHSQFWRELDLFEYGLSSTYEIEDIGHSPNYIWLKTGFNLIPIDPTTGEYVGDNNNHRDILNQLDENRIQNADSPTYEIDLIEWGYSKYGEAGKQLDISPYSIEGDWIVRLGRIRNRHGREIHPTVSMTDLNGNIWIGTQEGAILKGWQYSHRLQLFETGISLQHVTMSYLDPFGIWWFGDSQFQRTGIPKFRGASSQELSPFLISWDEEQNAWNYYQSRESISIQNTDIHDIYRSGNFLYLGTLDGLLILNITERTWKIITHKDGLYDNAVWSIIEHDQSLYIATSDGINEVSMLNHKVIPHKTEFFEKLKRKNVYDLQINENILSVASELGLFTYNFLNKQYKLLSSRIFNKISTSPESIWMMDNHLWEMTSGYVEELHYTSVYDFSKSGNFIWINHKDKAELVNHKSGQIWEYSHDDGIPGKIIYQIGCDQDWVWFLTDDGVAFYHWSETHYEMD